MAKKRTVNKTEAVEEYLNSHPEAGPKEIVAALAKQRIKITPSHVSNIKGKLKKGSKVKKAAKRQAAVEAAAPVIAEKPVKPGDAITLEQVKKVAQAIRLMGGFLRMTEVLEVIKETGGMKKFKDLAEAMWCPDTSDDIPF